MNKQHEAYAAILKTFLTVASPAKSREVHDAAKAYKVFSSTTKALKYLCVLELLKSENEAYTLLPLGKSIAQLTLPSQLRKINFQENLIKLGHKCCKCEMTYGLTQFQGQLYCERHLNFDYEVTHIPRGMSMLGLAQEI